MYIYRYTFSNKLLKYDINYVHYMQIVAVSSSNSILI